MIVRVDRRLDHGEGRRLVAVPPGVVTAIGPVVARAGTVAVILVSETTVKVACVLLNLTAEAPVKLVPMMVTDVPTVPWWVEDVMVGRARVP